MSKRFDVETLWRLERLGAPSLSPDGAQAVASVTVGDMAANKSRSALWLFSTLGGAPRPLTHCGAKDGQPSWSPRGDAIAFVAQREQQGVKDEAPQLYRIAPDGGEAERMAAVPTGVDAFRWLPDGSGVLLVSWVWPALKGGKSGLAKKLAQRLQQDKDTQESGYATSQDQYRYWDRMLPAEREPVLLRLDFARGRRAARLVNLFEGTRWSLPRADPDANAFDVSPDGRRVAFVFDPHETEQRGKRIDHRLALAELELASGQVRVLVQHAHWSFSAPRYSPDGAHIALLAQHAERAVAAPDELALWSRADGAWSVVSADWDRTIAAPLAWADDGSAIFCAADDEGRRPLWRFDLATRQPQRLLAEGTVLGFDVAAGVAVAAVDGALHPAWLLAIEVGAEPAGAVARPRRLDRCNDETLAGLDLGRVEARWVDGALGDRVQVWLHFPPGFDRKRRYPLLQVIHGGPHTAFGDSFHYRWNAAVFAAAGYVVAAVNYHGSTGYGRAFAESIQYRYGELETIDVEAATDALLHERWADARRVFAAGGSYGGFMVAWLNGHVPRGRYAAYVCHAGCFDWDAMFADDFFTGHQREFGAWYWDDAAQLARQSPHAFAHAMETPTLVVHGALDYRVPDQQGLAYYNTLRARGVDARLLWFPDENHWVLKPRNSRQWYREFLGWLERHDEPRKPGKTRKSR